jgi:dihydrofolate synthase/folylpolyglutamate synthase
VDWAIIETGMGGRMDATNMIQPELTVITNISLEHKTYLGPTISAIAGEKAGIIKHRTPVVTGVQQAAARKVILNQAEGMAAPVYLKGRDFRVRTHPDGSFSYYGLTRTFCHCAIGLQGRHQTENASLVLAGCELLQQSDAASISDSHIRSGLLETRWPGRLEIASENPFIILDGAHNLMAARALADHLSAHYPKKAITLVLGILDDKPYGQILKILADVSGRVIVTRPVIDRALPVQTLAGKAERLWHDVIVEPSVDQALRKAISLNHPGQVICVAGSLYVVGEAKTTLSVMGIFGE